MKVILFRLILEVTCWSRRGDNGMYSVHDWAEVHRLHRVEGMSKAAVAAKLSMSRNTVARLLASAEPPRYVRQPAGSQVDRFAEAIAAMLDQDPRVPATGDRAAAAAAGVLRVVDDPEGSSAPGAAGLRRGQGLSAHDLSAR